MDNDTSVGSKGLGEGVAVAVKVGNTGSAVLVALGTAGVNVAVEAAGSTFCAGVKTGVVLRLPQAVSITAARNTETAMLLVLFIVNLPTIDLQRNAVVR